jgi:4-amino-4-deoxy-L-arabinose transferase-like glycosyltransferase
LFAVPFSFVVGYDSAIAIVDTAFLMLGTYMMYKLGSRLFGSEEGFISAVAFATALPVLAYGAAVLTDGPGYAMLVTLVFAVLFILPERQDAKTAILVGALIGVGILTKEWNVVVVLFLWVLFLSDRSKLKLSNVLIATVVALLISFGWAQYIGHSYFGFYREGMQYGGMQYGGSPGYKGPLLHPRLFLLSLEYAFSPLLLGFAFIGFFYVENSRFKVIFEILFSAGMLILLWPTLPEHRFTFLAFPAIIPLAAFAISRASATLAERPFFRTITRNRLVWLTLILIVIVFYTNLAGLRLIRLP